MPINMDHPDFKFVELFCILKASAQFTPLRRSHGAYANVETALKRPLSEIYCLELFRTCFEPYSHSMVAGGLEETS